MPSIPRDVDALQVLETPLRRLCDCVRLLPNLTPDNAAEERARLTAALRRGQRPVPAWQLAMRRLPQGALQAVDMLREAFAPLPGAALYLAKLDELALELALVEAIGSPRRVRPLAARRFGRGRGTPIPCDGPILQVRLAEPLVEDGRQEAPCATWRVPIGDCEDLAALARQLLDVIPPNDELRHLPPDAPAGEPSAAAVFRRVAMAAGLDVSVRVDARLAARAASGDRVLFVADRRFGARECLRLAAHEVLGHLAAAANARAQTLRIFELGTAGSFVDQEGLAIYLEELAGLLDGQRLRTLAARVVASDRMHEGADFGETAHALMYGEGFSADEAVAIAERAYRGGGVARDSGYLLGWIRVRDALQRDVADVDGLRAGRLSLEALPHVRELMAQGLARRALYRPNLLRSLFATESGTVPSTLPPRDAASLTRLELT